MLNALLQPAIAKVHLLSLGIIIVAAWVSSTRWASVLSLIATCSSGLVTLGLALLLLAGLAMGGGLFLAFGGAFVLVFLLYLSVFVVAVVWRPKPAHRTPLVWCIAILGFTLLNGACIALPYIGGTTITIHVRDVDSRAIPGATLTYKRKFDQTLVSKTSDGEGRIAVRMLLGDKLEGGFAPFGSFGSVEFGMFAPKGREHWCFRQWSVPFGTNRFAVNSFFMSSFDDPDARSFEVFLPSSDGASLLPYTALQDLASQLRAADQTGNMFNPELRIRNLESYIQLSDVIFIYEAQLSSGGPAPNIFIHFEHYNRLLERLLHQLSDPDLDQTIRDNGLKDMLSVLRMAAHDAKTWQEKRDLIRARLDSDRALMAKPSMTSPLAH
ncbi:MAG: hypothetical protein ACK4UN_10830 [Limisphaerales bacterium]